MFRPPNEISFAEQPKRNAWSSSPCSSGSLNSGRAADLFQLQPGESRPGRVMKNTGQAAVDHCSNAVDGDRALGQIGRADNLANVRIEYRGVLLFGAEFAVEREETSTDGTRQGLAGCHRLPDFDRARKEHENVILRQTGNSGHASGNLLFKGC